MTCGQFLTWAWGPCEEAFGESGRLEGALASGRTCLRARGTESVPRARFS